MITSIPVGGNKFSALQTLLKEASIEIPVPKKLQTRKPPMGVPWNQPKKTRRGDLDPADFVVIEGFFLNQDQPNCAQLS